ncbi:amidase signature enzyme [Syncephalis pseudoplumigaleata]|uniref:Glutamyl-tRNA(Gln) amidotransferase subunit A, mitochondrial n=1 Tax=Syncephalis pseudoplumigaleata TaxID=1712513 RepID=A0A4P9Z4M7_9FUNG|nr:amidase signature enzyme [Syncephalis pseudoplumigaleata]|eukprot:RKP27415.1 amidase signature enzyme [Syncephalis pseudoplumigaleata]
MLHRSRIHSHAYEDKEHRPLEGVLVAVKDNFCTTDLPTTCASKMLKEFISPFEASVVTRLKDAGAIIVGKTNMDEFGMGSANLFSAYGPVHHPLSMPSAANADDASIRVAGGSSGGSAAAVAAGLCHAAIGSDTGGSVRLPSAYCGIVGFKPSYGQCSRYGLVSYASSLDTVGILAQHVDDAQLLFEIVKGHDPRDASMAVATAGDDVPPQVESDLAGIVVGIPEEYYVDELSPEIVAAWQAAADHLQARGAEIRFVSCPHTRHALAAYYVIAPAEASSNLARYDGIRYGNTFDAYATTRQTGFGDEVQRRLLLGSFVLSESAYDDHFVRAQRVRRLVQQDFDRCFRIPRPRSSTTSSPATAVDVLLTPCNITTAPTVQEARRGGGGVSAYVNDVMTVPASLAGIPAISIPWTRSSTDDYPIGVQLMAQYGQDAMLLRVARALEPSN